MLCGETLWGENGEMLIKCTNTATRLCRHLQELNVLLAVEPRHVGAGGDIGTEHLGGGQGRTGRQGGTEDRARVVYLHLLVESVVKDEGVSDAESVGLHGVQLAVVEVAHFGVVEIRHLGPGVAGTHGELGPPAL